MRLHFRQYSQIFVVNDVFGKHFRVMQLLPDHVMFSLIRVHQLSQRICAHWL